ncbi:phosphoglycerate mutase-like protein 4 [Dorcoceras hygrometricum]|uniref:Phosphoglycerate mutase-like protein 4 n=1 Tax=Dorcoceras hygrometricum TaxID=472368 RepID=A0A2Z7AUJ4_9LAMI|nr:phosphoglycerate mutase-like protein 4 [Dorcoceras hygrometricum]
MIGLSSNRISPRHSSPFPPPPIVTNQLDQIVFRLRKNFSAARSKLDLYNFMADSDSRNSVLPRNESVENGGLVAGVGANYAEIVVIRHGETEWNADGRIQGHLDVDLNHAGRQQAIVVAERLSREPKISAVYSSDLKRASDTAQIIAQCCGVLEVTKDPNLRERHLGDLQGVVFSDIAKVRPEAHKAFVSNRKDQEIPGGGESLNQLYARCTSALQKIAQKHQGERVVVVSHGGAIRALYRRASPHGRSVGRVMNTSLNVFHISDEDEWSIKSWGDVSHLGQSGFLKSGFGGDRLSG